MKIQIAEDSYGDLVGLYVDGVLKKYWALESIHFKDVLKLLGIEFDEVEVDDDWLEARKTGLPKKFANVKIATDDQPPSERSEAK